MSKLSLIASRRAKLDLNSLAVRKGHVVAVSGLMVTIAGLSDVLCIGDLVEVESSPRLLADVLSISSSTAVACLHQEGHSVGIGSACFKSVRAELRPSSSWKGRILNSSAEAIDGGPRLDCPTPRSEPRLSKVSLLDRGLVDRPLRTGVRAIDLFTPICLGQRIGIFAGSGVGKSTLLAMLVRSSQFDSVVIGLIGERLREVNELVETLRGEYLDRTIIVVGSSTDSAVQKRNAASNAMTIAEYLRDEGESVLLVIESFTRFAHALRDISLAIGELPVVRGYPSSVFSSMPRFLERAGPGYGSAGTITAILSVLIDGDDHNDPVSDSLRGTLDGHILLDRMIANRGQFPAIDVLSSVSRLASACWSDDQALLIKHVRSLIAEFEDSRDLRSISGSKRNPKDRTGCSLDVVPQIYKLLQQRTVPKNPEDPFGELAQILRAAKVSSPTAPVDGHES